MTNLSATSSCVLKEEIRRLITLCSHISQVTSRIQLRHLSNISLGAEYIKCSHQELLSMAENIEGSAILLESLLATEKRNSASFQTKLSRYHYNRDELIMLRQRVTPSLSIQIKNLLDQVVERECNPSNRQDRYFPRNIRTILI
ncbi:unnamed protein product [Rotaria socialis]|uniref:Uncharacterized protein n=1 Tax=Rotaria socialis TaxID=392032 RepID=A0A817VDS4_9BILA|nr:unnamed protein product [Rotaria socialis]CAF3357425.1 unnamed protein product [Rotaria socialis]CAF3457107.1 unnamed protein product [Rotaria socialis]CAF3736998.1 unnamed protein product [Rotaria socialis]CAF4123966.1 unnamed protein product [Rotaria socialis]